VNQLDLGRHFQLGMLCSFQIFLPKSTFQQDMELVGYLDQDSKTQLHRANKKYGLVYFGNLVGRVYKHFLPEQSKYHKYNLLAEEQAQHTVFLLDMANNLMSQQRCSVLTGMPCSWTDHIY